MLTVFKAGKISIRQVNAHCKSMDLPQYHFIEKETDLSRPLWKKSYCIVYASSCHLLHIHNSLIRLPGNRKLRRYYRDSFFRSPLRSLIHIHRPPFENKRKKIFQDFNSRYTFGLFCSWTVSASLRYRTVWRNVKWCLKFLMRHSQSVIRTEYVSFCSYSPPVKK